MSKFKEGDTVRVIKRHDPDYVLGDVLTVDHVEGDYVYVNENPTRQNGFGNKFLYATSVEPLPAAKLRILGANPDGNFAVWAEEFGSLDEAQAHLDRKLDERKLAPNCQYLIVRVEAHYRSVQKPPVLPPVSLESVL